MIPFKKSSFEMAENYIYNNARDIDICLFELIFKNKCSHDFLKVLKNYQNEDGGFGHGIEPDFWLKESSPIATTFAFQYLDYLNENSDNVQEIKKNGLNYFIYSMDKENLRWISVPKTINNFPHAPWWHYNEDDDNEDDWGNPSAEITGYLNNSFEIIDYKILNQLNDKAIKNLIYKTEIEMHELSCYIRMYENFQDELKALLYPKLKVLIKNTLKYTEEGWKTYSAVPSMFIFNKNSDFADDFSSVINDYLNYLIKSQNNNGSWTPTWQWGWDETNWNISKKIWSGLLTVKNLFYLKDFGRI